MTRSDLYFESFILTGLLRMDFGGQGKRRNRDQLTDNTILPLSGSNEREDIYMVGFRDYFKDQVKRIG